MSRVRTKAKNRDSPMDSQRKHTMFQGCEVTKVKGRHELQMTLMVKFVKHSRTVPRFEALGF